MISFSQLSSLLIDLIKKAKSKKQEALLVLVLCFAAECIANPKGAINTFMIHFIDLFASLLPSTPAQLTLGGFLNSYQATSPLFSVGLLAEIFSLVFPLLSIYLVIKLYKFLPFT